MELRKHKEDGYGLNLSDLPTNQSQAKSIGSSYYFTGKSCKYGHLAARYTRGGSCSWCSREKNAKKRGKPFDGTSRYALANMARATARLNGSVTYVSGTPCKYGHTERWTASTNCVECDRLSHIRRNQKSAEARIKKLYGLDAQEHEALFINQNNACALCGTLADSKRELHVDHCHDTKKIRGLLCSCCNQAIGLFKDNPNLMRFAAEYVER